MDELIKKVAKQAKISPEQAKAAVDSVLAFLKGKLPAPVFDQINAVLSGKPVDTGAITNALGGILGGKKK